MFSEVSRFIYGEGCGEHPLLDTYMGLLHLSSCQRLGSLGFLVLVFVELPVTFLHADVLKLALHELLLVKLRSLRLDLGLAEPYAFRLFIFQSGSG